MKSSWLRFLNKNFLLYVSIFFISLVFFIYLTFPYAVLKDVVTSNLQRQTGHMVLMDSLGPSLPLGIAAKKVSLSKVGSPTKFNFDSAKIKISFLKLFIGRLALYVYMQGSGLGKLRVNTSISLLSLFQNNPQVHHISINLDSFKLTDLSSFALKSLSSNSSVSPILQPVLGDIALSGFVDGQVSMNMSQGDFGTATGLVDLTLKKSTLNFGEDMDIAPQTFSRALVKGDIKKGLLSFDPQSGLESVDLKLDLSGNLKLAKQIEASNLNMILDLQLMGALNNQFGFILNNFSSGSEDGSAKFTLKGPIANPQFN